MEFFSIPPLALESVLSFTHFAFLAICFLRDISRYREHKIEKSF